MKGYLSVAGTDSGRVRIDSRAKVYRDPADSEEIIVETDKKAIGLGVSDVTVSRKKGGEAPIVIEPSSEFIEVQNVGNTNGLTVKTRDDETEVEEGHLANVRRDAELSIGFNTELQLIVEREAKVEQNVVNHGEGDVVLGDQRNIDNSTTVGDDNVINRTDIGGNDPADVGDDNVINRSEVGGNGANGDISSDHTSDDEQDTQFCTECGTELPAEAVACFACGKSLEVTRVDAETSATETRQFCEHHERTYTGSACPECGPER
jgi:hypothetical protein